MKKFWIVISAMCVLFTAGCSSEPLKDVDKDREKAMESVIFNQPGGTEIPERYLDISYELARIAADDWEAKGSPSGITLEWAYSDAGRSILGMGSIGLRVGYPDENESVYSILLYP